MDSDPVRLHAVVRGLVQGVGFRYWVQGRAQAAGLRGWVRNLPDGSVECRAEGPREALEKFLGTLAGGPGMAAVTGVEADWGPGSTGPAGFEIRF